MDEIQKDAVQGTSRRTVVKAAAWAAPVVAVAAAAPMAAATVEPEPAGVAMTATNHSSIEGGYWVSTRPSDVDGEEVPFPSSGDTIVTLTITGAGSANVTAVSPAGISGAPTTGTLTAGTYQFVVPAGTPRFRMTLTNVTPSLSFQSHMDFADGGSFNPATAVVPA